MNEFTLLSSETLPLTKDVAEKFKAMTPSPTERALDVKRVKHLREKADAGLLTPFSWSFATIDGKEYRMNGQHSSTMLCELNGSFPDGLQVHMDKYSVDSVDGLALLFRQFDDRKSSRTPSDVSGAYQGLYPELADVPRPAAKIAIEGAVWYRRMIEGMPQESGDDQYRYFADKSLHGFVQYVGDLFSIKTPELKKVQIISAIYGTFAANEASAREFWQHVARGGVEYEDNHPSSILADWLLKAKNHDLKENPKPAEYYNSAIYAWNAFREGKDLKSINIGKIKSNLEPDS